MHTSRPSFIKPVMINNMMGRRHGRSKPFRARHKDNPPYSHDERF